MRCGTRCSTCIRLMTWWRVCRGGDGDIPSIAEDGRGSAISVGAREDIRHAVGTVSGWQPADLFAEWRGATAMGAPSGPAGLNGTGGCHGVRGGDRNGDVFVHGSGHG